jgi:hypothetical protein
MKIEIIRKNTYFLVVLSNKRKTRHYANTYPIDEEVTQDRIEVEWKADRKKFKPFDKDTGLYIY